MAATSKARFTSGYYVANMLVVASYLLVRLAISHDSSTAAAGASAAAAAALPGQRRIATGEELRNWEMQCLAAFVAIIAFKLWRRRSWDHAAAQVFFYSKLLVAVTVYMISPWLLAGYCAAFWAIFALLPQPIVDLTESGAITALTPTTLKEASLATDGAWMVYYYTHVHGTSVAGAPAFLQVATEFASAKLRFGCFDVLDWPRAAADMKMTTNTWSSQLPAVVLYEKGREWGRLPPEESANDPTKRNNYTRGDIVRLFKLEDRFSRPLQEPGAPPVSAKPRSKAQ